MIIFRMAQSFLLAASFAPCLYAGMNIAATREAMGLSKNDLAEALGVHLATIYRLEAGQIVLSKRTQLAIEALAKAKRVKVVA